MSIPTRGASQIKTLAAIRGSGAHSGERHVRLFKVASLELERARRAREREAAMRRIDAIEAQLFDLDAQIQGHQEALGLARALEASGIPVQETRNVTTPRRRLRY